MAALQTLQYEDKIYISRRSAEVLKIEELLEAVEQFKAKGLTPLFVEAVPSISSIKTAFYNLKSQKENINNALAALAVLFPGNEEESTLKAISQLIDRLGEVKSIKLGPYKFKNDKVNLDLFEHKFIFSPEAVYKSGCSITNVSLRKAAKEFIKYWQEGLTSRKDIRVGSRWASICNSGNMVSMGCQNFSREEVEAIFVKVGILDEVGNILV